MKPKWSKLSHKSVLVSRGGFSQSTKCQEYLQQDFFPSLAMALTTRLVFASLPGIRTILGHPPSPPCRAAQGVKTCWRSGQAGGGDWEAITT